MHFSIFTLSWLTAQYYNHFSLMSFLPWYGETPLLTKVRNSLAAACTASLELFMMKDCENNWGNSKYKHKQAHFSNQPLLVTLLVLLVTAWNQLYSCFGDFHYHCFGDFHIFSKLMHMNKLETTKIKYKCTKKKPQSHSRYLYNQTATLAEYQKSDTRNTIQISALSQHF